jgi:hypothetical protein
VAFADCALAAAVTDTATTTALTIQFIFILSLSSLGQAERACLMT